MKKIIIIIIISMNLSGLFSQSLVTIPYYNWSNKISFMTSPGPVISGYGYLSDSLSRAHNDSTFYEYNGLYYPITCWADYYLWYVDKYWLNFHEPSLYRYYYDAHDDYGMASYICGNYFIGNFYPSRIAIIFPDRIVKVNNLSVAKVEKLIKKNRWDNEKIVLASKTDDTKKEAKRIRYANLKINHIENKNGISDNSLKEKKVVNKNNQNLKNNSHNFSNNNMNKQNQVNPNNNSLNKPIPTNNTTNHKQTQTGKGDKIK